MPLLLLGVLLATGAPAVTLPAPAALDEAVRRGDDVELERLAQRLGAARLVRTAARPGSGVRTRRAALRALALLDDAWVVAGQLVALLGDGDVGEAAARTARRMAERLGTELDDLEAEEVPPDVPRWTASALLAVALHAELPDAVRVDALAGALALAARVPPATWGAALDELARDPRPSLRRAALEARDLRADTTSLAAALGDDDGQVAITAGGLLCGARPMVALDEPARARVRALAVDDRQALAARRRLAQCLRAFATPADNKLASALLRRRH